MPKPLLNRPETRVESNNILSASRKVDQKQEKKMKQEDKMKLDRLLRKKRSKEYMDAISNLDAGGHVHNEAKVKDIIDALQKEFPEVELSGILLGYVSICYLGVPYEVHTLDISGQIIQHYKSGEPLPGGMEKARSLAMRGGYAFIEVYIDCCRCVSSSGAVSVVSF